MFRIEFPAVVSLQLTVALSFAAVHGLLEITSVDQITQNQKPSDRRFDAWQRDEDPNHRRDLRSATGREADRNFVGETRFEFRFLGWFQTCPHRLGRN